jgi:hypothetical protein
MERRDYLHKFLVGNRLPIKLLLVDLFVHVAQDATEWSRTLAMSYEESFWLAWGRNSTVDIGLNTFRTYLS